MILDVMLIVRIMEADYIGCDADYIGCDADC